MSRRLPLLFSCLLALAACNTHDTSGPAGPPVADAPTANSARVELAQRLARTLADPTQRASVKRRLDASRAPEGKLQFQALVAADQGALLGALARDGATTPAELLADLDAARGLELYLPVPAQRAAWQGDDNYLVATIGEDNETPMGFDRNGNRVALDPRTPPSIPVIALVPQETDFTRGRPALALTCIDLCDEDPDSDGIGDGNSNGNGNGSNGGGDGEGPMASIMNVSGLFLTQSHIEDNYESWLKGSPEYEYHVYGLGEGSGSDMVELACTGESAGGVYSWNQDKIDWSGAVMLFTEEQRVAYEARHPNAPVRIMAWEDDDEPCVDHANADNVSAFLSAIDAAYRSITSGKVDPWYVRGIKSAPSIFKLISAAHHFFQTNDELIGNAVEASIAGAVPGGANWVIKADGTRTVGWFTTAYRR